MKTYCQEPIALPGNANTYCMRESGHEGKHMAMDGGAGPESQFMPMGPMTREEAAMIREMAKGLKTPVGEFIAMCFNIGLQRVDLYLESILEGCKDGEPNAAVPEMQHGNENVDQQAAADRRSLSQL